MAFPPRSALFDRGPQPPGTQTAQMPGEALFIESTSEPAPRPSEPWRPWRVSRPSAADSPDDSVRLVEDDASSDQPSARLPEIQHYARLDDTLPSRAQLFGIHSNGAAPSATARHTASTTFQPALHERASLHDRLAEDGTPYMFSLVARCDSTASVHGEVALRRGEVVHVLADRGDWWDGLNASGQRGTFPKAFCTEPFIPSAASYGDPLGQALALCSSSDEDEPGLPLANLASFAVAPALTPGAPVAQVDAQSPSRAAPAFVQAASADMPDKAGAASPRSPARRTPARGGEASGNSGRERVRKRLADALNSTPVFIFMLTLSLFVLYVDDLVTVAGAARSDEHDAMTMFFLAIKAVSFLLFIVEFGLACWVHDNYVGSVFFVLDVLAIISLIPDVTLLFRYNLLAVLFSGRGVRTGRAAQATARAARLVRIVRIARLAEAVTHGTGAAALGWLATGFSLRGQQTARLTVTRLVAKLTVAVLVVFFAASLLQAEADESRSGQHIAWLHEQLRDAGPSASALDSAALVRLSSSFSGPAEPRLLALRYNGSVVLGDANLAGVWKYYDIFLERAYSPSNRTQLYFLVRARERTQAGFNVAMYTLVILVLVVGSALIVRDVHSSLAQTEQAMADSFRSSQLDSLSRRIEKNRSAVSP